MALLAARRQEAVVVLVAILALANSLYSAFSESEPWTEWINKGGAFRALPSFTLGVASCLFRFRIARWPVVPGALLAVLAAFILLGWLLSDMAALVVVYAIAILAIQCDMTGTSTLLTRLRLDRGSVYTYSCYMLHIPVATIVLTLGSRNLVAVFPEAKLVLLPAAVAVLAVASILSYRLFETPLRRYLNSAYDRHFTPHVAVPAISSRESP
jgi:peptidoglycan/LPS O-acetylase OafA/YrhL